MFGIVRRHSVHVTETGEQGDPRHKADLVEGDVDVKTALAQLDGCMVAMEERHRRSHGC